MIFTMCYFEFFKDTIFVEIGVVVFYVEGSGDINRIIFFQKIRRELNFIQKVGTGGRC